MTKPRVPAWILLIGLTALLLTGCATQPAAAPAATATSAVIETIAPAEDAQAFVTPEATGEAMTVPADDALPEGPDRLAALDDPRGAEGAVLTPEQLAGSAGAFAQFTGLEGLTASQPELREGSPDFLARTIVFTNSGGELVGMVVAINETTQMYIWVNADGEVVCQQTDQAQPLEGAACAATIAQYWDTTVAAQQEQAAAAEAQPTQSWTVYTAEDIAGALANPESKIRDQARYVLGADSLSDDDFAAELGGRMAEITTVVDDSSRTNMVVFDRQTNLDDVVTAVTAAREQGLKLLGSTLLYVTHDADGAMRIWHTGTFTDKGANSWIATSYQGLQTFVGFISVNPETGEATLNDVSKDNYWLLGMGSLDDYNNKRIGGPARLEFRARFNPDGSSSMLSVSPIDKAFEFVSDPASPGGYRWKSYATPDMRENGAAEIMPSLDKVKGVLADLDTITSQSSDPAWFEGALQDYNGAHYLEVTDTSRDGRLAYLVLVSIDATTGERLYGPIVLVNSGNFDPNSGSELIRVNQPLNDTQLAQETIYRTHQTGLAGVMIENNIMVISANSDLPPTHKSSHTVSNHFGRKVPTNFIHFNLNLLESAPELRSRSALRAVIIETFELLGHEYFAAGSKPPLEGFFFTLNPQANQTLVETDFFAFLHNAHLNALAWLNDNQQLFSETDFQRMIEASYFSIDFFLKRIGTPLCVYNR